MGAQLVETKKTKFSQQELVVALIKAWNKIYNKNPEKKQIAVIFAQWSIESGQGDYCWNYNLGNIKYMPSKNPEVDESHIQYMMLKNVWEIIGGAKIFFQPPHKATWFRAFPTLLEGVEFHFNFLRTKRYSNAWKAVEDGSPAEFSHLLKVAKYYTAPEADYIKSVSYYFNKFMKEQTFENALLEIEKESKRNEADTYDEFSNAKKETSSPINKAISLFKNLFNR